MNNSSTLKRLLTSAAALLICTGAITANAVPMTEISSCAVYLTAQQQEFIEQIGSAARKGYARHKILPSLTIAQAIWESGWNSSLLSMNYYNYFGIKAGSDYSGQSVNMATFEVFDNVTVNMKDNFRAYSSMEEGIEGYYKFITSNPRYNNLIGETNYITACKKIKSDGWATAPDYAEKLIGLIEDYNLTRFDTPDWSGTIQPSQPSQNIRPTAPVQPAEPGYFRQCSQNNVSLVDALVEVGAPYSSKALAEIAAANGIVGYSGAAEQNIKMLQLLKSGKLADPTYKPAAVQPTEPVQQAPVQQPVQPAAEGKFPKCSQWNYSIVEALMEIGAPYTDKALEEIAAANGIVGYSHSAEDNIKMLRLLKSGELIDPNSTPTPAIPEPTEPPTEPIPQPVTEPTTQPAAEPTPAVTIPQPVITSPAPSAVISAYYPPCASEYGSLSKALTSLGIDTSEASLKNIAAANGIYNYSNGTEDNIYMLNLLKNGYLIRSDYRADPAAVNCTVYLDANGGAVSSASVTSINGEYRGIPIPTRAGYLFDGWYDKTSGIRAVEGSKLLSTSAHTLSAQWHPVMTLQADSVTLHSGEYYTIASNYSSAELKFQSYSENNASVASDGTIRGLEAGSSTIEITNSYGDKTMVTVNVLPHSLKGDCNLNGRLDISDIVMLEKHMLGTDKIVDWQIGDVNGDMKLDSGDRNTLTELILENLRKK